MRVVIHKNGMLEMSIINVIFLTNVEKCGRAYNRSLLSDLASAEKCDALDLASFLSCATAPGVGTIQFCESYVYRQESPGDS